MDIISLLFIANWFILPIVWYAMLKVASLDLCRITLPVIVIVALFIYQYIGIPYLYFGLDSYRAIFVTDKYIILKVWIMTSLTISTMICGYILARYSLGPLSFFRHSTPLIIPLKPRQRTILILLGILSSLVLYKYLSIIGIENTALSVTIGLNDNLDINTARSLMGNDFSGGYHWYRLFMRDVLSFVILALYANYIAYQDKPTLFFLIVFSINLTASLLMAAEKGPMANFLIAFFLINIWVKNKGTIEFTNLIKYLVFIVAFLTISYIYFMNSTDILSALSSIFSRSFTGQIQPAYHYLELFPAHQDWLYGRSFPNPGGILPFEQYRLTVEVMNFTGIHHNTKVVGSMPTVYWGELYANFGYTGVLLAPMLIGFSLYFINYLSFTMKFNPVNVAFFIWLMMHYKNLSTTGISKFIIDINLLVFLFIIITLSLSFRSSEKSSYIK